MRAGGPQGDFAWDSHHVIIVFMTLSTASNGDVKSNRVRKKLTDQIRETCPHVGLPEYPETWLAFSAEGNCRHDGQRGLSIDLKQQESYCLNAECVAWRVRCWRSRWQICCMASDAGWDFWETVIAKGDTEAILIAHAPPLPSPTATPLSRQPKGKAR